MPGLAELLLTNHEVEPGEVEAARARQRVGGGAFVAHLLALGRLAEPALEAAVGRVTRTPVVDLEARRPDPWAQARLGLALCRDLGVYPVAWAPDEQTLWVAVSDPTEPGLSTRLRATAGARRLRLLVAGPRRIRRALDRDAAGWGDAEVRALAQRLEAVRERQGRVGRLLAALQSLLDDKGLPGA